MLKTTYGLSEFMVSKNIGGKTVSEQVQGSNVAVRANVRDHTIGFWQAATTQSPNLYGFPWRLPSQWDGGITGALLRAFSICASATYTYSSTGYPEAVGGNETAAVQVGAHDRARFRISNASAGSSTSGYIPKAIGAFVLISDKLAGYAGSGYGNLNGPGVMIASDIPYSNIGTPYIHPPYGVNVVTTAGNGHMTSVDNYLCRLSGTVRVDSGPDKGTYFWHHSDRVSGINYLMNMDGTPFVASNSGTVGGSIGVRLANMNEVGVPPGSTGSVAFDGLYDPGENRTSYLMRLRFEKSGSPSPSDANQKGSYWFTIRPWLYGDGTMRGADIRSDYDAITSSYIGIPGPSSGQYGAWNHVSLKAVGHGCMGAGLDRINQRLWFITGDNAGTGNICWWRLKSPECIHELLSNSGASTDGGVAGVSLGTSNPRGMDIGSDGTAYFALNGGTLPGFIAIKPDLTGSQYTMSSLGLSGIQAYTVSVDKSRYRTGTAGDVTTSAGTGNITTASGAFTQSDVGRVIKITGTASDNNSYKISVVTDATHVTVQTLAGAAVSFTGGNGGTFQIGDRIYLFFYDTANNVNKLYYFESLAFGVLYSKAVTMTNGAQLAAPASALYMPSYPVSVDQATGCLYWASQDTAVQINRYDPAANTWSRRLLSDFNGSNGGSGTIVNPTVVLSLGVNPHASFREVWVGTDAGWVKLNPDSFAGSYGRYYGGDNGTYVGADGKRKLDGSWNDKANTRNMYTVGFGADGRVFGVARPSASTQYNVEVVIYNREADCWTTGLYETFGLNQGSDTTHPIGWVFTPYGEIWMVNPWDKTYHGLVHFTYQIHYQYIGGQWVPKEAVRGPLPDNTAQPGLQCKDMHTTSEALIMGVRCRFTPQGGATLANNEFLGRLGKLGAARSDGAWQTPAAGSALTQVFLGSGFIAGNVGDYIWVKSSTGNGASVGYYQILTYTNGNTVTVRKISNTSFSPGSDSGTLTYELWSMGSTANNECCSVILGHGVARDNTQDITNIYFDFFGAKTLLSDQQEGIKFCVEPPGPPKCPGIKGYVESYAYNSAWPLYTGNYPQGVPLPGSPTTSAYQLFDGALKFNGQNGVNGLGNFSWANAPYSGRSANTNANYQPSAGAVSIDLGSDVEVGSVIVRVEGDYLAMSNHTLGGSIAHILNAPVSAPPTAVGAVRASGTQVSITSSPTNGLSLTYRTLTSNNGDFLGSLMTSASTGSTVAGQSRFSATGAPFSASHLGAALKILSGSDIGSYRITNVAADGSYVDVRNLDQTAKTWVGSAASLSWEVRDSVREDDIIELPVASPTAWLTVERLLTATTLEVRIGTHQTYTNVTWQARKPCWNVLKRFSYSVMAQPPDVVNNGTYVTVDGGEIGSAMNDTGPAKFVADFSDLTTAQRTGRYWKFAFMTRFGSGAIGNGWKAFRSFELYDPSGKLITVCKYNKLDTVDSLSATFLSCYVTRLDFIQANNAAASHVAGSNGTVTVGGTNLDTLTLGSDARFLGFQVRQGTGSTVGGVAATWTTDSTFVAGDVGRILRIVSGPNAGYYRVGSVVGGTGCTVTTINNTSVTFAADAGPTAWTLHEGIAALNDYFAINGTEALIGTISDDLKTLTISEAGKLAAGASASWEIRRRAGRYLAESNYPTSTGQYATDQKGAVAFFSQDIDNAGTRSDGATTLGTAGFTGTKFTPDDVGRLLIITGGSDQGAYEIATYVSATSITVKNLYTGGAVSFVATAGTLTYKTQGERRFRISRYATVLRG